MVEELFLRREDLPPIQKHIYVMGTFEGEALRTVSGYKRHQGESVAGDRGSKGKVWGQEPLYPGTLRRTAGRSGSRRQCQGSPHTPRHSGASVSAIARGRPGKQPVRGSDFKAKLPSSVLTELVKMEHTSGNSWNTRQLKENLKQVLAIREEVERNCRKTNPSHSEPRNRREKGGRTAWRCPERFVGRERPLRRKGAYRVPEAILLVRERRTYGARLPEISHEGRAGENGEGVEFVLQLPRLRPFRKGMHSE
jgi:hypothetical protein